MSHDFVGRADELALLGAQHEQAQSAFIPIYGRRRVGKSELITRFMHGKRGIYFVGKTAPAGLQLREFLEQAAQVLDEPLLASLTASGWKVALEEISKRKGKGKLVIALDEFQWLAGASPELPSVLQELWDRRWSRSGDVTLILCGSYVGFMEREVLGKKSPLFGRRTAQIQLQPFGFREAAGFHKAWSLHERALAYFICGGIPFYLRLFHADASVEGNIESALLSEMGALFREPDFLLREELREVDSYYAVLLAIAEGLGTVAEIGARSGVPTRSLPYYLQQLVGLNYVARRHPLSEVAAHARQVRYVLTDPLLRFWFRFVFPNLSVLQQMGPRATFRDRIRPELPAYFGGCFERLCREALPRLYQREGVNASFKVGEYWDKQVQVDVVGVRDDGWIDLGECKWGTVRSVPAVVAELDAKAKLFPNPKGATLGRRVFTSARVKADKASGVRLHDLDDLYR